MVKKDMAAKLFNTAEELQLKIDEYIESCKLDSEGNSKPLTYTGLAYHLGFASRQSIWEYSKRTDELSLPIKRAMLRIEQSYEESLRSNNATGSIFALKNRGWKDKTELEHTTIDDDGKSKGFNFVEAPVKNDPDTTKA